MDNLENTLKNFLSEFKQEMQEFKEEMHAEMQEFKQEMRAEMQEFKQEMLDFKAETEASFKHINLEISNIKTSIIILREDMERNFASVRAEIKEAKEDIKELRSDVNELRADVNELKEKFDLLESKVDTHTLQLSSLENSVRTLGFRADSFLTRFKFIENDLLPLKQSHA